MAEKRCKARKSRRAEFRSSATAERAPKPPENPFDVLGVPRDATSAEIKQAYRRLAFRYHPDAAGSAHRPAAGYRSDERAQSFHEIQQAYQALQDRYQRARWEQQEQCGRRLAESQIGTQADRRPRERLSVPMPWRRALCCLAAAFRHRLPGGLIPGWGMRIAALGLPIVLMLVVFDNAREESALPGAAAIRLGNHDVPNPITALIHHQDRAPRGRRSRKPAVGTLSQRRAGANPDEPRVTPWYLAAASKCEDGCNTLPHRHDISGDPGEPLLPAPSGTEKIGVEEPVLLQIGESRAQRDAPAPKVPVISALPTEAEVHGRWVAYCFGDGELFRASLELTPERRFRWIKLGTEAAAEINGFEITLDLDGTRSPALALHHPPLDATPGGRLSAELKGDLLKHGSLRWRVHGLPRNASVRLPCEEWLIAPEAFDLTREPRANAHKLEGLWVLPVSRDVEEGSFLAEYVELRLTRNGSQYRGVFVGRYGVPSAALAREMRFTFHAAGLDVWSPWKNDAGVEGEVLLAPIGASRLGVIWKRRAISSGRPALSGGVQVLRKMD
ncbi:MAG: J domain-containing protein [Bryobacterales bacterium]|nr:J domain-containing protein [Bryobacterales bacterium]